MWPFKKKEKEFDLLTIAKQAHNLQLYMRPGHTSRQYVKDLNLLLGKELEKIINTLGGIRLVSEHLDDESASYGIVKDLVKIRIEEDNPYGLSRLGHFFVHTPKGILKRARETEDGNYAFKSIIAETHFDNDDLPTSRFTTGLLRSLARLENAVVGKDAGDLILQANQFGVHPHCPRCGCPHQACDYFPEDEVFRVHCREWSCRFSVEGQRPDWGGLYNFLRECETTLQSKLIK